MNTRLLLPLCLIPIMFLGCEQSTPHQAKNLGDNQAMNTQQLCPVEKKLILQKNDHAFIAKINYLNVSQTPIYIDSDVLQLYVTFDGEELDDISRQVKRKPKTIDQYIKLLPKQDVTLEFNLLENFEFQVGTHQYQAHLIQDYWDPISDKTCEKSEQIIPFEYTYVAP